MMIGVSGLLAIFLGWSVLFGGGAAGAPPAASAVTRQPASATQPANATPPLESCFKRYRREAARCGTGDGACRLRTADQWDLCEATGFWP